MFGTSVRGALSTLKNLISWFCTSADRLMVASATSAKHYSDKSAALIKRTSTVSRDALRLKKLNAGRCGLPSSPALAVLILTLLSMISEFP